MDLTIEGKAYINGAFEKCCIGIERGKIASVKKILKGDEHLNFGNKLILPGGVDIHVHFRDPGFVHKEDFSSGSKSAAFGGITCVFDMPNTHPQTIDTKNLVEKIESAKKKSFVDFGIYAGITDNNIENINDLSKHCNGFKIYLGSTTNSLQLSEQKLQSAFKKISETQKPVLIHAENDECLRQHRITEKNLSDHLRSHPAKCEEISIKNILNLSQNTTTKIHICHLSSCEGFEVLKTKSENISIGVTPHHLMFDIGKIRSNQTLYKVNPPLRINFDRETLLYGFKTGAIDILESDHAPHTLEEKNIEFDKAPSGIPGVETMFPLFLAEVKRNNLSFERLISLMCERPANLMKVPKGKIEVGRDADLIVVDLKEMSRIKAENLHSKCNWTPFEGMNAIFPTCVFVRGEKLIEECEMLGRQGFGRFVGE